MVQNRPNPQTFLNIRRDFLFCLFLVLATLSVYWQIRTHSFVVYDDPTYVAENKYVLQGITREGLEWAFSFSGKDKTHWHPVTWISHMLDVQLYGVNAGNHLMINLVLHLLGSWLLFLVFKKASGRFWESAAVAVLFALHPINVESVAWVAARKNVLSTFFWMLVLLSYIRYARKPNLFRYGLVFFVFGIGLMTKPMLVTLPFVLLLMDFWPLGRIKEGWFGCFSPEALRTSCHLNFEKTSPFRLIIEKIPLLALSGASIFISSLAMHQYGDLVSTRSVPMGLRLANAIVSYPAYVSKLIWPLDLTCFYPFPEAVPIWQVFLSALLITGITLLTVVAAKTKPYLIVGWLWYLGTLVPAIGILQAGLWPAIADRFVYVPSIGFFVIAAWGLSDLKKRWRLKNTWSTAGAVLLLALMMVLTWKQAGYWKDSIALFRHALVVAQENSLSHYALGYAYEQQGDRLKAIHHYSEALKINPAQADALYNLAHVKTELGRYDEAVGHYRELLVLAPDDYQAHNNLGNALFHERRFDEAITHYLSALHINPEYALAYKNLGAALIQKGQPAKAVFYLKEALRIQPDDLQALQNLRAALTMQSNAVQAGDFAKSPLEQMQAGEDFRQTPAGPRSPNSNPMDDALGLIGLDLSFSNRPLPSEDGYMIMARVPLIDRLAQNPFFLYHWANKTSDKIQQDEAQNLTAVMSAMLSTMTENVDLNQKSKTGFLFAGGLAEAYAHLCEKYDFQPNAAAIKAIHDAGFSDEFDRQMGKLVYTMADATLLARRSVEELTNEEIAYITSHPERYFFPDETRFNFLTAPTYIQERIVTIARKIDFLSLFTSAQMMAAAFDRFSEFLSSLKDPSDAGNFFKTSVLPGEVVLHLSSPIGDIVVLGQGENIFEGNGALVVDLGGDDRFTGPVGVGHRVPGRISLLIDIDGDDVYDHKKETLSQGFGCLSVGMLIDIRGNDRYLAGDMAQGSGMFGVGLLADFCGEDFFQMGLMGQGFGLFGFGLLVDKDGSDRYLMGGMGQGAGSTLGFGCLADLKGNDKFMAGLAAGGGNLTADEWTHAQGSGFSVRSPDWRKHLSFYGGIGFLSDGSGDDIYVSGNGNCMGSSYFMSIGCLVDHRGSDIYAPQKDNGIASAVHLANAVLIDREGDDRYFAGRYSGGFSSDRSVAMLIDDEGNDIYGSSDDVLQSSIQEVLGKDNKIRADIVSKKQKPFQMAQLSFGAAYPPDSFALLIDYEGDDRYFALENGRQESCGGVVPPAEPRHWSHAVLLDLKGKDFYSKSHRQDNHYFRYFSHGLCYDTEYNGQQIIAQRSHPRIKSSSVQTENLLKSFNNSPIYTELLTLATADLYSRFAAIGKIVQSDAEIIFDLIAVLGVSQNEEMNHDLIEALNHFIVSNKMKPRHGRRFQLLLKARDPFVRRYAARTLGWRKIKSAVPSLLQAIEDEDPNIRADVILALGQIGSSDAVDRLLTVEDRDASPVCRRVVIQALTSIVQKADEDAFKGRSKIANVFKKALNDPDEITRTDAASGLCFFGNDPAVILELKKSLKDSSIYVQRAAAKSLILNHVQEGIPVLIESLKFPSIDTFENYDHELAGDLAYFCGIDFSQDRRYNYETWRTWWQQNGSKLDLKHNLLIMAAIEQIFKQPDEESGIRDFERLLAENPSNTLIRKRYSRFCFEWITYRLLTQERITEETLTRCLRLQKIKTKLEPENAQVFAGLATLYIKLNQFNDAVTSIRHALELEPDNSGYIKALEHYKYLAEQADEKG